MNYMPDIIHLAVRKSAARRVSTLQTDLERLLPAATFTMHKRRLWIGGGTNGASVELVRLSPRQRAPLAAKHPDFDLADELIQLCSGPNHDYSYFPIFYDVELALLQLPGIRRIFGDELRPLAALTGHFEWVAERLAELGAEDRYDDVFQAYAAGAMQRLTEVLPDIEASPVVTPWLIRGVLQDDDLKTAEASARRLAELRPPEAIARLRAALSDKRYESALPRLLRVYRQVAAPPVDEADAEGGAPDPEELARLDLEGDPWERWTARYALACRGRPRPLVDALGDPDEARDLVERADMTVFIDRTAELPEFDRLLDDYIEATMDENERYEALIAAIADLCRERLGLGLDELTRGELDVGAGAEYWQAAGVSSSKELRRDARTIAAALRGDDDDDDAE
ncbi:MAG: hypothetical protein KC486_21585 [Myxococcales bacterium]|nr:hypothetical protein [Myxococcales bacterium]